jgi:hypothetical protein
MKKYTIPELENMLDWLNEAAGAFNNGYAEYVLKKYKKSDKSVPLVGITAILFGNVDGAKDDFDKVEEKYSEDFFKYIRNNYRAIVNDTGIEEPIVSLYKYKSIMRHIFKEYAYHSCSCVKKKDLSIVNDKFVVYCDTFTNLNL